MTSPDVAQLETCEANNRLKTQLRRVLATASLDTSAPMRILLLLIVRNMKTVATRHSLTDTATATAFVRLAGVLNLDTTGLYKYTHIAHILMKSRACDCAASARKRCVKLRKIETGEPSRLFGRRQAANVIKLFEIQKRQNSFLQLAAELAGSGARVEWVFRVCVVVCARSSNRLCLCYRARSRI